MNMIKFLGIIFVVVGITAFVNGVRAFFGHLEMQENDKTARFYVGIKGVAGGLAAILLGVTLCLTY